MPRYTSAAVALATLSVCFAAGGCAPPVVKVHHSLPAALPVPAGVMGLRVGEITVAGPATQPAGGAAMPITPELAEFMKARLGEHLYVKGEIRPRVTTLPAGFNGGYFINGTIHPAIRDIHGTRKVLLLDPATHATTPVELPTFVRLVRVRVELAITWAGEGRPPDGQDLGTAEIVRSYDSALAPAVRGKLGLERPDDPNRVPPVETIIDDLLDQCARAFKRMITPTPADAELQLRAAAGAAADKGLAAAGKADWSQAVSDFQKALAADPNSLARNFNLAVAAEAGDQLDLAAKHYQRAYDLSGEKDNESYDGARRCRRVLEARKLLEMPSMRKGSSSRPASSSSL